MILNRSKMKVLPKVKTWHFITVVVANAVIADSDLANVLREHSREVSGFVEGGMPCMGGGMMRKR